jgi:hypothetical protein
MIQRIASSYHARSATTTTTTSTEDTKYHNDYNNNNNNRDDNQSNNHFHSNQTNINMIYNHKRLPTLNVRKRLEKEESSHSLILPRILSTTPDNKREDNQKERTDNNNDVDVDDGCQDYDVGRGRSKDRDVMICGIESSFAYILFA